MGYTTKFSGAIGLSRKLTFAEAKYLLEMAEDSEVTAQRFGMLNYMQWVPTETLDGIVWDGNEKFYDYIKLMERLCMWLGENAIVANGFMVWGGESAGDFGTLFVKDNLVIAQSGEKPPPSNGEPLSIEKLGEMALAELTAAKP